MTSLLVTLATTFVLLGFASSFFYFWVRDFFVATFISFEMFLITRLGVSKLIASLLKNVKHNLGWCHYIHYQINGRIFINRCI